MKAGAVVPYNNLQHKRVVRFKNTLTNSTNSNFWKEKWAQRKFRFRSVDSDYGENVTNDQI
jgi:hypothetical protein